ncbi:flagellar biosynthetic protein FliR [Nostoc sp. HG1]|nr:flagellar biosynthetic protein FliR [Nostoc sp. HG1]
MIPVEFANVEMQLQIWLLAMLRPGAAFLAAPIFSAGAVPLQLRLVLALAIGIPSAAASGMALPDAGMMSIPGLGAITSEIMAGLALGFAVQIGFAAALIAGETISNSMGLGFAAMADPTSGQMSPAIGQFLSMLATFLFLAADGHLALIAIMVESYSTIPPGAWLSSKAIMGLVQFGGLMFSAGLAIAMPVTAAMVVVQIILAMISRSAPTLNLFSVGMPAALLVGILLLAISAPVMADAISHALVVSLDHAATIAGG